MRPVKRPKLNKTYSGCKSYLPDLVDSFGNYCSYCERWDKNDVEHVIPKTAPVIGRLLKTKWDNLLLGCPRCNRDFKRAKNPSRAGYIWPDQDNTFNMLEYYPDGRIKPRSGLSVANEIRTKNTIRLVRLDDTDETQKVLHFFRKKEFKKAEWMRSLYQKKELTVDQVVEMSSDAWSVWLTVFFDDVAVRTAIINNSIIGTNTSFTYTKP